MEALQYIYTSWKNGDSADKGFMIYSRSESITKSECIAIKDAMKYRAPRELSSAPTPREISDIFPYAFSYFVLPTGRGCVAQSTYLGQDYSGRYGNYIIYAMIFNINDLPCRPAEFFAESYIKTSMTQEELDAPSPVPPLPPLQLTNYSSVVNDEQLREFLSDKENELAKLISMVLAARDAGVPFYLNDSRENLVLWSASIQRILPFRLSKKFTFNTYVGDHEAMRSQRVREEGLDFHLIGVRPDANYFNYAIESCGNRCIVLDFIGGYMTPGVPLGSYAKAMAESLAFDCEEVDSFGDFIDALSFNEINSHLQDAYLCYQLLKNDAFEFDEKNLKAVISFGSKYCTEDQNSEIGSRLISKCREEEWKIDVESLEMLWDFVCRYSSFMAFTLFEVLTETIYVHASMASGPCEQLESLLLTFKNETKQQYSAYLKHMDSLDGATALMLLLNGLKNPFAVNFYIKWILSNYEFNKGLDVERPASTLLRMLLESISKISGCEKTMIEILTAELENGALFKSILSIFVAKVCDQVQLQQMCVGYVEVTELMEAEQINRFEQLLMETPGATSVAARMCSKRIASVGSPEDEFWRSYENQRLHINKIDGAAIEQMILACIDNVDAKTRGKVAIRIIKNIDHSLINGTETIRGLTDAVNDFSVKALLKMENAFLQSVCQMRAKVANDGIEKVRAVCTGKMLTAVNEQHSRMVNLSNELMQAGINLQFVDNQDYMVYMERYFADFLTLVQTAEDVSMLMKTFYHRNCFSYCNDEYISALRRLKRREPERWICILGWTCMYVVSSDSKDSAANMLHKTLIRYLRSLNEDELLGVRQAIADNNSGCRCDCLFEEACRTDSFSEKLQNFIQRKFKRRFKK